MILEDADTNWFLDKGLIYFCLSLSLTSSISVFLLIRDEILLDLGKPFCWKFGIFLILLLDSLYWYSWNRYMVCMFLQISGKFDEPGCRIYCGYHGVLGH